MDFLNRHNVTVLEWPALSLDISPIKHIWGNIGCRLYQSIQQQNLEAYLIHVSTLHGVCECKMSTYTLLTFNI